MNELSKRVQREKKTINLMIEMYCEKKHNSQNHLCKDCIELLSYANDRLEHCKFGKKKPVCAKCKIHCYKPTMRERVKEVMRFTGPRMIYTHPYLGLTHLFDSFRKIG